jgi:hypothetical protein
LKINFNKGNIIKNLFIKSFTNIIWRIFPKIRLNAYARFAIVEKNSCAQLLRLHQYFNSSEELGLVFNHAVEELTHSKIFKNMAGEQIQYSSDDIATDPLINNHNINKNFIAKLAYISISEDSVNHNFDSYQQTLQSKLEKNNFKKAQKEEEEHAIYTRRLLRKYCIENKYNYSWVLFKAYYHRYINNYIHYTQKIGEVFLYLILSIVYFTLGLFSFNESKHRLNLPVNESSKLMLKEYELQIKKIKK